MEKKSMFRVKMTGVGVERTKIEIENTSTKECFCDEVDKPKKDVLCLLGVRFIGEGEYTDDVDDIGALLTNLMRDQKLQDFCDRVEDWIRKIGSEVS